MRKFYSATNPFKKVALLFSFLLFAYFAKATTYYSKATGNANILATWGINADGTGTAPANFITTGDLFILRSASTLNLSATLTIGTAVTLQVDGKLSVVSNNDDIVVNGIIVFTSGNTNQITLTGGGNGNKFTLSLGATLKTANVSGIRGSATSSLPVTSSGSISLNFGANYEFNGSAQSTTGLPSTVNDLTFSGSGTKTISSAITTVSGNFTTAGTASVTAINTMTLNGNVSLGTGTIFNGSSFTHLVKGNWTNANNDFVAGTSTMNFNGSALQTITGTTSFNSLIINNTSGLSLASTPASDILIAQSLQLTNGIITTNANNVILGNNTSTGTINRTNGFVSGNLREWISGNGFYNFFVGGSSITLYRPATITFNSVTQPGYLTVTQLTGPHPQIILAGINPSITPYWNLTSPTVSGVAGTYDATFTFLATDASSAGIGAPALMVANKYSGSWATTTAGTNSATTNQVKSLNSFGDFAIGTSTGVPSVFTQPSNATICSGTNTTFTAASTSKPDPSVKWQRSTNGSAPWIDITASLDAGITYSNFATNTLILTGVTSAVNGYQYRSIYTNLNGSSTNATPAILTVTPAPSATIGYSGSPYGSTVNTAQAVTLTGTIGGTFTKTTGAGTLFLSGSGDITPSSSTPGTYTVTYTIAASGGCSIFTTTSPVIITLAPTAQINYAKDSFCKSVTSSQAIIITGTGNYTKGSYSVSPLSGLSFNTPDASIVPSTSTIGTYTVTYNIPADNPYPASTTTTKVTITAIPTAAISYTGGPFCSTDQTADPVTLTGTDGGTYTASPSGLIIDASTGAITPFGSTVNTYTITYTTPAKGGCSPVTTTTSVQIVNQPSATLSYSGSPYCKATTAASPALTGAINGTYSSTSGLVITSSSGVINPSTSNPGDYVVTYTIPANGTCGFVQVTANVSIVASPTGNINYSAASFCAAGGIQPVTFTDTTGITRGGTFSSNSPNLIINSSNGDISPANSIVGNYNAIYTTPGCPVTFTTPVQITAAPSATINYSASSFCISDGVLKTITLTGDQSGTFSATGPGSLSIDINSGAFTPSTTSLPGTYTVTYTIPASGACAAVQVNTTVIINALPVVTSAATGIVCSGVAQNYTISSSITGTTYNWRRAAIIGISNATVTGQTSNPITEALVNTTSAPIDVVYIIVPTAGGCPGASFTYTVTVNPTPVVTTANTASTCSGTGPNISLTSSVPATFTWTIGTPTGSIISGASAGSGILINQTLTNPSSSASGTVQYVVTPTASTGGCVGVAYTITVTVNPTPAVTNVATATTCNGTSPNIILASSIPGTFAWTIGTITGNITGATASSGSSINQILSNSSSSATGTVPYVVTPTSTTGTCAGAPFTITVTVKPTPNVTSASTGIVCSGFAQNYTITSGVSGATYSWSRGAVAGISNAAVSGQTANSIAETLTNTTTLSVNVIYIITPAANSCTGTPFTYTVTVNPTSAGGTISASQIICQNATPADLTLSGGNVGTVVKWQKSANTSFTSFTDIIVPATTLPGTTIGALSTSTYFRAVVQSGTCDSAFSNVILIAVNPPFTPVINVSPSSIVCKGQTITLSSGGFSTADTLIGGDFSSPKPLGWTGLNGNASNNNNSGNLNWGVSNNNTLGSPTITYSTASSFYMIVSGNVNSILNTAPFSTVGRTSLALEWYQGYQFNGTATGSVQISIDGGLTYTTLAPATYNSSSPAVTTNPITSNPKTTINLNSYLGQSDVRIRFNYSGASSNSSWALDNVNVVGPYQPITYSWPAGFTVINDTSATIVANTVGTNTFTIPTSTGGCASTTSTIPVTVNPTASITAMTSTTCGGTGFTATPVDGTNGTVPSGTTYTWSAPAISGAAGNITGGSAQATGQSSVGQTLTNTTNTSQTATYTVTPLSGTCTGSTFTVTVTVNPKPGIANKTAIICSETAFSVTPVNGTDIVPVGVTYTWSVPVISGAAGNITGGSAQGTGQSSISQTLTNITNTAQTATYTVTPLSGTCTGNTFTIIVTVNPKPGIANKTALICSGTAFSVTPINGTDIVPVSVTYTWSAPAISGATGNITGSSAQGTGQSSISQTLTNTTNTSQTATYTVTPLSGTCPGSTFTVMVTVNAIPSITAQPSASAGLCLGGAGTISVTGGGTIDAYKWQVSANGGTSYSDVTALPYSGFTTSTLNISPTTVAMSGYLYHVILSASSACTSSVTSNPAAIKIKNVWTGKTNTDWNVGTNWSDGNVASISCAVVYIPSATNAPILGSSTASITNLNILAGGNLTINGSGILQIAGTITKDPTGVFDVSSGSIDFNGVSAQSFSGNLFVGNTLKNLTVSNASGLTVSGSGIPLNITGVLGFGNVSNANLNTGDNIVLISNAAGTAMVDDITKGGTGNHFTGKVAVERYYPARRAWRLVTAPLSGAGSVFSTWQNGGNYVTGVGTYVTGPTAPAGGLDLSIRNNPSLKTGSLLTDVSNTINTNLSLPTTSGVAGNQGFLIFVRGDRLPGNTLFDAVSSNNTTLSSKGTLQTGNQQFNILSSDPAYVMIGNPYAAPIDFFNLYKANSLNNIANEFVVYDPQLNLTGGFISFTDPSISGTYGTSVGTSETSIIQSSQAIFMRKADSSLPATVKFSEPLKSTVSSGANFRPMNDMVSLRTNLYLRNADGSTILADGNFAQFDSRFNAGVNRADALKFANVYETLGLLKGKTSIAISYQPILTKGDTIYYKFSRAKQRKYQFEFVAANLEQENLAGFIEDKFLNKATPINMNGITRFDFEGTPDAASTAVDRFKIVFKPSVIYTSLTANVLNSDIAVEWNVASETNIKGYDIERSTDGVHFTKVSDRASSGNNATSVGYNWLDVSPALGYYYYRIRSISNNNVVGYSNVVKVKLNKGIPAIYVFPNPVTENILHLQMNSMPKGVYGTRLINNLGQVLGTSYIDHLAGTGTETIEPNTRLLSGIYQLEITAPDKKTTTIKVIVK